MLHKKGLVVVFALLAGLALTFGCSSDSSSGGGGGSSLTVTVNYTGSLGTISASKMIILALTDEQGDQNTMKLGDITTNGGSYKFKDVSFDLCTLMVSFNADGLASGGVPFTTGDPWVMYDNVSPNVLFAAVAAGQTDVLPDYIDLGETSAVTVTLTDDYTVDATALANMSAK